MLEHGKSYRQKWPGRVSYVASRALVVLHFGDLEIDHDGREASLVEGGVELAVAVDVPQPSLGLIPTALLDDARLLDFLQSLHRPELLEPHSA